MTFYFTARATFDKEYNGDGISWEKYLEWSKLTHLTELVSVDSMLNALLVDFKPESEEDWNYVVIDSYYETGFFTTLDFVIKNTIPQKRFNLLSVVVDPKKDCNTAKIEGFEFVGYDLLDKCYDISALSNCGGFDETFSPSDLNNFGLIDRYQNAIEVRNRLLVNNPDEYHADTNVIAIWRHKLIGRDY